MTDFARTVVLGLILLLAGCSHTQREMDKWLDIAKDPRQLRPDRERAGAMLDGPHRKQLQAALIRAFPADWGDWDRPTGDAIVLLGEIGDEEALATLETVVAQMKHDDDKLHTYLIGAIEDIRTRLENTPKPRGA